MDEKDNIDVSVIVLTYNAKFCELKSTLLSIIFQKNISFEVIVADDGSSKNNEQEMIKLFEKYNFNNYRLLMNEQNQGTVCNLLSAVNIAEGEYIKDIGQGDFLVDDTVLYDLYEKAHNNNLGLLISDPVYFYIEDDTMKIYSGFATPQCLKAYKDRNKLIKHYIIYNDIANGATAFYKKEVLLKYLNEGKSHIKFMEDQLIKLMILDDVLIDYCQRNSVFYETSSGISSSAENRKKYLKNDADNIVNMIENRLDNSKKSKKIIEMCKRRINRETGDIGGYIKWVTKDIGLVIYEIKRRISPRKTSVEKPDDKMIEIGIKYCIK